MVLVAVAYVLRRWLRVCPCAWLCICLAGRSLCECNLAPPRGGLGHRHRGVWGAPTGCNPGHTLGVFPGVPPRQYRHRRSSDTLCAQSGPTWVCVWGGGGGLAPPGGVWVRCVCVGAHACSRVRHAGVGARTCPRARRVGAWERGCAPVGCHLGGSLPHMAWLLQVVFEMVAFSNWQARTPCGQANCQVLVRS